MVSIIMTVYNDEKYVEETIKSILDQTYKEFEFLIYNDASTDESMNIINKYSRLDKRIKSYNDGKLGRANALNFLVTQCKGTYIANIDSDDPSYKDRIFKQVNYLNNNKDVAMIGTGTELIDGEGVKLSEINPETDYERIKRNMVYGNPFIHSSVMVRREILIDIGNYNKNMLAFIDYELWIRLLKNYKATNLKEILCKKRIHKGQFFEGGLIPKNYNKLVHYYFLSIKELNLPKYYYLLLMFRILYYKLPFCMKKTIKKLLNIYNKR